MKEIQEIKLKGELHNLISANATQQPNEDIKQYNGRLIDLTNEFYDIFIKYYEQNVKPSNR